jgi:hypothetical protein
MAPAAAVKSRALPRVARSHLPAILAIAIVARVVTLLVYAHVNSIPSLPSLGYEDIYIALSLHNGHGFSSPFGFPSGPTALLAPGYPLLIAGVMRIFGTGSGAAWVLILFQIFLSLLTLWLLIRVARQHFGMQAANLAGFLFAICEPMLFAPLYIWDTCLSALILTAAIAVAPSLYRSNQRFVLVGIGTAIAVLVNPALSLVLFAIFSWSAWRARFIPWAGVIAFLIVFSPWPIRNAFVMHSFIPLRTSFGYELWMGNHAGADGNLPNGLGPRDNSSERHLFLQNGEVKYVQLKGSLASSYISAHPAEFAQLTGKRFVRFWAGTGKAPAAASHNTIYLSVLSLLGLALLWRRRQTFILLSLPLLIFPFPYYITHAEVRYQFVVDPVLAILAGYACQCFFAFIERRPLPVPANTLEFAANRPSA